MDFLRPVETFVVIREWARLWQDNNYCFRSYNVSCMSNAETYRAGGEKDDKHSKVFFLVIFISLVLGAW